MTPQPPLDGASSDQPHLRVISQYIKELTFRNAMAAAASQAFDQPPSIEIGVEIRTRPIGDTCEAAEVDLIIGATALQIAARSVRTVGDPCAAPSC